MSDLNRAIGEEIAADVEESIFATLIAMAHAHAAASDYGTRRHENTRATSNLVMRNPLRSGRNASLEL